METKQSEQPVELYEAPEIEVIDIETSQNIFGGSGTAQDMNGEDW